ncbi:MAG: ATP-dependent DNA helicase, partial [Gammaproteobacteria bacterium]
MSDEAFALLGEQGPFVQALSGFRPRLPQQELARAIESALAERGTLVAEAGTGVGKTFAYLVPALLSGRKVLLSTGTRTLQDQLYHKDLPIVRNALGVQVRTALLKGRANYLCLHRHALAEQEHRWRSRDAARHLALVRNWLPATESGDLSEVDGLPEDSEILPRVTSTVENCLGLECPDYNDCFVVQARRRAQEADVVVINHHLFLADMALREEGFGELLPSADAVILDEAHQLPDVASSFFGEQVSARQIQELARDTVTEQVNEAPDMGSLRDTAGELEKAARDLRLAMGAEGQRGTRDALLGRKGVEDALDGLADALERLGQILELAAERGKGLESCHGRCLLLHQRLKAWHQGAEGQVAWFEVFRHGFSLNLTPLEVGGLFARQRERFPCAWVFTSATLAVGKDFGHFTRRLGIEDAKECIFESPFDFSRQAMLYVPPAMPDPREPGYVQAVVERALPLLEANGGRAFMLFTSYRA